jgi:uncharacterized iron-regulated protein
MIPTRNRRCQAPLAAIFLLLAACSSGEKLPAARDSPSGLPEAGLILDTRSGKFISRDALMQGAIVARYVILGEVHDNSGQHRLQAEILRTMLHARRAPALAMEQFDLENQSALDAARARGERDPERLADAGRLDRKGWRWPDYKPLVELAAANNLPLLAADLSRGDARVLMKSGRPAQGLAPATPVQHAALEQDIIDGHCGIRPPAALLLGMIEAQRARDARMAEVLERVGDTGAVLIAGKGHARRDRGVPSYLSPRLQEKLLSIAFQEVAPDGTIPQASYAGVYDLVWFTPRAIRDDPCRNFRLQ